MTEKTIFISSFHPLISRNVLATGLLDFLIERGIRVVILAPSKKEDFFKREFEKKNVEIKGVPAKLDLRDAFLRYLALAATDTRTLRIKRMTEMRGSGAWVSRALGNSSFLRSGARLLSYYLTPSGAFDDLFARHKPDLVFATDVQNDYDARLIAEGRRRRVKVVGMVRSWDNLTSKGLIRVLPDTLILQNEILKKEAMVLHGIPESAIKVIGVPHYDFYFRGQRSSREDFFRKTGGDARKKLLLFSPTGDRYLKNNTVDKEILEILDEVLPLDWQIFVRFPPTDTVSFLDGRSKEGRIIFERPAKHFATPKNTELSQDDDKHLADSLYFSDVVVAGPSTMCVDAALFDKPVILAAFDGKSERPYYESVRRYFDYNHFDAVLKSGGARLAESRAEFVSALQNYLDDPRMDHDARRNMMLQQCRPPDGEATRRLANLLLTQLS